MYKISSHSWDGKEFDELDIHNMQGKFEARIHKYIQKNICNDYIMQLNYNEGTYPNEQWTKDDFSFPDFENDKLNQVQQKIEKDIPKVFEYITKEKKQNHKLVLGILIEIDTKCHAILIPTSEVKKITPNLHVDFNFNVAFIENNIIPGKYIINNKTIQYQ